MFELLLNLGCEDSLLLLLLLHVLVTVVVVERLLVVVHQLIELVGGSDALLELTLHLCELLLKPIHEVQHAPSSLGKRHNLTVLARNLRLRDRTYERVVGLNASQLVFGGDFRQQRQFSLQRVGLRFDENREFGGFGQVGTPGQLLDKHVEQETPFFHERLLFVANHFFGRNGRNVQPREPLRQSIPQNLKIGVSSVNLEPLPFQDTQHGVNDEIAVFRNLRIRN